MNNFILKKETRENLYEGKGLWMMVACSIILTALCFLVVTLKETMSMAQNDILQYAIKASMFIALSISMILGSSSFASEREENTLESLLLTPISKLSLTLGKFFGIIVVGLALYAVSVPYIIVIGTGTGLVIKSIIITLIVGGLLLAAFGAISVAFSILMKSSKVSILTSVMILIVFTLPALVTGLFKSTAFGQMFLKINPISACFNMMSAILVDKVAFSMLWQYIIPIVIFVALSIILMVFASKKVSLRGEK